MNKIELMGIKEALEEYEEQLPYLNLHTKESLINMHNDLLLKAKRLAKHVEVQE
ncbi:hypothetical protein [Jeotgalibaca porci]|uniref:hypothetical protein n=1 Tax=Jeotgalibaca porci TaxID=1868793 RepID=UPI00359FC7B5